MARKPRDTKAEYARRKARGIAAGLSPSEYRGHGAQTKHRAGGLSESEARRLENLRRKEALGELTSADRAKIRAFVRRKGAFSGQDEDEIEDAVQASIEWARANGMDAFNTEAKFIRDLGVKGQTIAEIEWRAASGTGLPAPWLYYYRRRDQMRGRPYTPRTAVQKARRRLKDRERRRKRKAVRKAPAKRKRAGG